MGRKNLTTILCISVLLLLGLITSFSAGEAVPQSRLAPDNTETLVGQYSIPPHLPGTGQIYVGSGSVDNVPKITFTCPNQPDKYDYCNVIGIAESYPASIGSSISNPSFNNILPGQSIQWGMSSGFTVALAVQGYENLIQCPDGSYNYRSSCSASTTTMTPTPTPTQTPTQTPTPTPTATPTPTTPVPTTPAPTITTPPPTPTPSSTATPTPQIPNPTISLPTSTPSPTPLPTTSVPIQIPNITLKTTKERKGFLSTTAGGNKVYLTSDYDSPDIKNYYEALNEKLDYSGNEPTESILSLYISIAVKTVEVTYYQWKSEEYLKSKDLPVVTTVSEKYYSWSAWENRPVGRWTISATMPGDEICRNYGNFCREDESLIAEGIGPVPVIVNINPRFLK